MRLGTPTPDEDPDDQQLGDEFEDHTEPSPQPDVLDDGYEYIWVKHFRHHKTGKLIRAADFGKDAIRLKVKRRSA